MKDLNDLFNLEERVAVITGGGGLLGQKHADAILCGGGTAVLVDLPEGRPQEKAQKLAAARAGEALGLCADITKHEQVQALRDLLLQKYGRIDILINNAANNPRMEAAAGAAWSRLEHFPIHLWEADIAVGLTGAFFCSQVLGAEMARARHGVILNIASDLAVIAPDQRLYREPGLAEDQQPVKPVTYSVVKTGLLGLTRYLATYWADVGVRVNAISPGGVYNGQPEPFVQRLQHLIPLGRMAHLEEYQGAVLFLCSDASSYMTGANLIIDGGRSSW